MWPKLESLKKTEFFIFWGVVTLSGIFILMVINLLNLKVSIGNLQKKSEIEFKTKVEQERNLLKKELDEKYRGNLFSFEATAKILEKEKNRSQELRKELKKTTKEGKKG